jgi:hypothetical protein
MKEFFVTNDDYWNGNPALRLQNLLNKMAGLGWALHTLHFYSTKNGLWVTCIFEKEV